MVKIGTGLQEFIQSNDPNSYVLRLKNDQLQAEKKGVWTWIKANILSRTFLCRATYHLPTILEKLKNEPPTNLRALNTNLYNRVEAYANKLRGKNKGEQANAIQSLFFEIFTPSSESQSTITPPTPNTHKETKESKKAQSNMPLPKKPDTTRDDLIAAFSRSIKQKPNESTDAYSARIQQELNNSESSIRKRSKLVMGGVSSIPEEVETLTNLKELVITYSNITTLPESMQNLTNLEKISFNHTSKIKTLPSWLLSLPNLKQITVVGNDTLENSIPEQFRPTEKQAPPLAPTAKPQQPGATAAPTSAVAAAQASTVPRQLQRAINSISPKRVRRPRKILAKDVETEWQEAANNLEQLNPHFRICQVRGDGHCLFSSIIIGFLARKTIEETRDFFQTLPNHYTALDTRMKNEGLSPEEIRSFINNLHESIAQALRNLNKYRTTKELIEVILSDRQTQCEWAYCFRLLAVGEEFLQGEDLLDEARLGLQENPSNKNLIEQTCTKSDAINVYHGGDAEIVALADVLEMTIYRIEVDQDAPAIRCLKGLWDLDSRQPNQVEDEAIILLTSHGHYDAAFLPTRDLSA